MRSTNTVLEWKNSNYDHLLCCTEIRQTTESVTIHGALLFRGLKTSLLSGRTFREAAKESSTAEHFCPFLSGTVVCQKSQQFSHLVAFRCQTLLSIFYPLAAKCLVWNSCQLRKVVEFYRVMAANKGNFAANAHKITNFRGNNSLPGSISNFLRFTN